MLKAGIVGLPNVGKSTLFNALTRSRKAEAANYPFCTIEPNIGVVEVPDDRLQVLAKIAKTQKIIPAAIEFVDIAGLVAGASKGEGLGNKFLANIREVDAVVEVVRCFDDDDILHSMGGVNPLRDIDVITTELILSDIQSCEKQLENNRRKAKGMDKEAIKNVELLERLLAYLNANKPANTMEVSDDDARVMLGVSLMNRRIFNAEDLQLQVLAMQLSDLVISKVYYSGTKDKMDRNYTADGYVELFNNSDHIVYADGLYLALAESVSPAAYPAKDNPDYIYARQICRFPGTGTDIPVAPGKTLLVAARSARNHKESAPTSVDLSHADFEVKLEAGSGNPDVPMLPIISNSTAVQYFNLLSGGPNAVFLFATDDDVVNDWPEVYQKGKTSGERFRRVPKGVALDAVECLKKPAQSAPDVGTKRFQSEIDAGYITINAVNGYNCQSVERRVSRFENGRYYLVDTNNSSSDFVVSNDPTPGKYDKEGLQ